MVERIRSVTNFVMDCGHRWFDNRFGVSELTYYNSFLLPPITSSSGVCEVRKMSLIKNENGGEEGDVTERRMYKIITIRNVIEGRKKDGFQISRERT